MTVSEIRVTLFWCPYKKDLTISNTKLGSLFSETPIWAQGLGSTWHHSGFILVAMSLH